MDIPGQGNVIQFNSANLTVGYCVPNIDTEGWNDSVICLQESHTLARKTDQQTNQLDTWQEVEKVQIKAQAKNHGDRKER